MVKDTGKSSLRIASYNIRKARGRGWRHDPTRLLPVLNGLGADVLALQEADHRLGQRHAAIPRKMIEAETDFRVVDVAENDHSLGWHGNAVLLHRSRAVSVVRRINLPGLEPRGAVAVELETGEVIVATHLGLRRRDRQRQLQEIRQAVRTDGPVIIAGDFNEWSAKQGLEPLEDAFSVVAPGRSFHSARPIAALDRIAHSMDITLADAGVVDTSTARRASDHLPIWADLSRTGRESPPKPPAP